MKNDCSAMKNDCSTVNNDSSAVQNDCSTVNNDSSTVNNDSSAVNNDYLYYFALRQELEYRKTSLMMSKIFFVDEFMLT